jgi:diadenosine tetraphosphate (Ap4A) HIT family hydrolase
MFQLHPRLAADTFAVAQLTLCELRLLNNCCVPWFILVPRKSQLTEVHQLSETEQQQLIWESSRVAQAVEAISPCHKINLGALGNVVSQLHWHVIGRTTDDPCWPGPVWGCGTAKPYSATASAQLIAQMKKVLRETHD